MERKKDIWRKWLRMFLICLTGVLLIAAAFILYLIYGFDYTLELKLEGQAEIYLEYGEPFVDPGVSIRFYGNRMIQEGIIPDTQVLIDGDLDLTHVGRYTVIYSADYYGYRASVERIVWIVDTQRPVIELISNNSTQLLPGQRYEEEGFRATDNYDGDITHRVIRTEKEGKILYSVADSSGNPCYVVREIPYYDPVPPEIILHGEEAITIPAGQFFEDPGYSASDNVDGDITEQVCVEGEVLWYLPGEYLITYSVTDSYGNTTVIERGVEVQTRPLPSVQEPQGKIIYLTFDDGPGMHTIALLDILDKYGIKATFFVVDSGQNWILREIVNRGHSIGIHTMTHNYNEIYADPEAYFHDLYGMQELIWQQTGVQTYLMRFPGGSSNTVSIGTPGIMTVLTQAVQAAGFRYFDWNVDSNDAGGAKTTDVVLSNIISGVQKQNVSVVLQHDIHGYSVKAVEDLIIWALDNGYRFLPLQMDSPICQHDVLN